MPSGMAKKRKLKWERKRSCKCLKANLPIAGRVLVRCELHRGKPSKSRRLLCYWDADGIVRLEDQLEA